MRTNYNYSKQDIEFIKYNFGKLKNAEIAKKLHRTEGAIKNKMKKLKLYIKPNKLNIWYKKIPVTARAYIAGHFDGEGCASFRKRGNLRTPEITVRIANYNTLLFYKKHFNGNIDNTSKMVNKKMYRWKIVGYETVINFILSITPFSIEKKEQLFLLKDYIDAYQKLDKKNNASKNKKFASFSNQLYYRCATLKKI